MSRLFAALGFLLAFAGAAHWVVPMGRGALDLVLARDDAARIADLELDRVLDAPHVAEAIDAALAADDAELAASYVALADARAVAVAPSQRARVMLATSTTAQIVRGAGRFGQGFATGRAEDIAGLAGATAGDLTVWGDMRDAGREAWHWASGAEVDPLMLGLSTAGLAATGATYATFGASLPARAGLSVLKGARRAGLFSARLAADVGRLVRRGGGGTAARQVGTLVADLGATQGKAGTRAAMLGLKHIDEAKDAARLRRLAEVKGGQTLAIVKSLGRGALFVTEALVKLGWWILAAALNLIGLTASFNALVVAMVRPLWRGKKAGEVA